MTRKPVRVPFTALATALFLAVTFNSTPSDPSVPQPSPQPPDFEEAQKLQDLAGWLAGRTPGHALEAIQPADLDAALRAEESGFELFPEEPGAAERTLLADLPFGQAILEAAERHRVDGLLVAAVVEAESRFVPDAVSPKGARGLMQVMPGTGKEGTDLFDPHQNLDVGSRYLGSLIDNFDGDLELALAAYNAGPAAVARYGGVPPYTETRRYVRKVIARYLDHRESLAEDAPVAQPAVQPARRVRRARASGRRPADTPSRAR